MTALVIDTGMIQHSPFSLEPLTRYFFIKSYLVCTSKIIKICTDLAYYLLSRWLFKTLIGTFWTIWHIQIQIYPQTSIDPKDGALYLKNKVSTHGLVLLVQLSQRVAPPSWKFNWKNGKNSLTEIQWKVENPWSQDLGSSQIVVTAQLYVTFSGHLVCPIPSIWMRIFGNWILASTRLLTTAQFCLLFVHIVRSIPFWHCIILPIPLSISLWDCFNHIMVVRSLHCAGEGASFCSLPLLGASCIFCWLAFNLNQQELSNN